MANSFAARTFAEENARVAGPKPAAPVVGAAPVVRRALGEVGSTNVSAAPGAAKPAARAAFAPLVAPGPGAGAADAAPAPWAAPELHAFDKADAADPAAVTDYVASIYTHFKSIEASKHARHGYMTGQADINEKMRAILIDWLVEVHLKFKLMPETMYLTVNLIDRYLELRPVQRTKLQLVGVTAMLLASKYEEIYAPEVRDFVYITDRAYTKEQILAMEAGMLNTLGFRITVPTAYVFVNRFLKAAGAAGPDAAKTGHLAAYLVERTLQEYPMLRFNPSRVAAAGVNMALRTQLGPRAWGAELAAATGYAQDDLRDTVVAMQGLVDAANPSTLKAVFKKYTSAKFSEVAHIPVALLE